MSTRLLDVVRLHRYLCSRAPAIVRSVAFASLLSVALPSPAAAQPNVWTTFSGIGATIEAFDQTRRTDLSASEVCFGVMTATPDRRSLFLPTNLGLARFDTDTRALVELLPGLADCSDRVVADPSGRWWFVLTPPQQNSGRRLRIVDAVAHRVVADTPNSTLLDITFDDLGVQYELHQLSDASTSYVLRRRARSPDGELAWETAVTPVESARYIAASRTHVFVSTVIDPEAQQHNLHRYDAQSGAAAGGFGFLDISTPVAQELKVWSMVMADGLLYVSGWYGVYNRIGALVLDAAALRATAFVTETFPDGWTPGAIAAMPGAPHIYRTRNRVQLVQAPGGTGGRLYYSIAIDQLNIEPPSTMMKTRATWAPFVTLTSGSSEIGQIAPPGTPHVTALSTAGQRVQLTWEPNADGAPPQRYIVRGGLSGQPASITLAELDANTRTWQSPVVPPGGYVLELVAANGAGEGAAARVDVGIATTGTPLPPTGLASPTDGHGVVELTWNAPANGPTPTGYQIEAAVDGGVFTPVLQTTLPRLTISNIPAGHWMVRVRSMTTSGVSAPSSLRNIAIGDSCFTATESPRNLAALTDGRRVLLQWMHPVNGPTTTYRFRVAADAEGLNTIATFPVDGAKTSLEIDAPPGRFLVTMHAESVCGSSAAANPIVLRIP